MIRHQLGKNMSIDTPQLLQWASNCMHEECNHMSLCLHRYNLHLLVEECAEEGLMEEAKQYMFGSQEKKYQSDIDLLDDNGN